MRERLNCPNCGMPIVNTKCEYCGTVFYDFADLDLDAPSYVRVKRGNDIFVFKAKVNKFSVTYEPVFADFYANNDVCHTARISEDVTIDISMQAYTDDRGVYLERRNFEST